eukprot:3491949-Ditylum_brightwellii.AAC.1
MDTTIPEEELDILEEKVTMVRKEEFPYLSMKLYWDKQDLRFAMYNNENQGIKYVNKKSCHCAFVFKVILEDFFTHMGQLTSRTRENENVPITELYPDHREVLRVAKILPKKAKIPTVKELYNME